MHPEIRADDAQPAARHERPQPALQEADIEIGPPPHRGPARPVPGDERWVEVLEAHVRRIPDDERRRELIVGNVEEEVRTAHPPVREPGCAVTRDATGDEHRFRKVAGPGDAGRIQVDGKDLVVFERPSVSGRRIREALDDRAEERAVPARRLDDPLRREVPFRPEPGEVEHPLDQPAPREDLTVLRSLGLAHRLPRLVARATRCTHRTSLNPHRCPGRPAPAVNESGETGPVCTKGYPTSSAASGSAKLAGIRVAAGRRPPARAGSWVLLATGPQPVGVGGHLAQDRRAQRREVLRDEHPPEPVLPRRPDAVLEVLGELAQLVVPVAERGGAAARLVEDQQHAHAPALEAARLHLLPQGQAGHANDVRLELRIPQRVARVPGTRRVGHRVDAPALPVGPLERVHERGRKGAARPAVGLPAGEERVDRPEALRRPLLLGTAREDRGDDLVAPASQAARGAGRSVPARPVVPQAEDARGGTPRPG